MKKLFLLLLMAVVLGAGISAAAGPDLISACRELSQPGNYRLTQDLSTTGTCFIISSDGVELDGNGYSIIGDGEGNDYGVSVAGKINASIINLNARNFESGIYAINSQGLEILNSELSDNINGARIEFSNDSVLEMVNAFDNNNTGIFFYGGNGAEIRESTASNNGDYGIRIKLNPNTKILKSSSENNGNAGIYVHLSSNKTVIKDNKVKNNANYGIRVEYSDNSEAAINEVENNAGTGIYFLNSVNGTVRGNVDSGNEQGIRIESSKGLIYMNTVVSNGDSGIYLLNSSFEIKGNSIGLNGNYGVYLESSDGNLILENNISSNLNNGANLLFSNSNVISNNQIMANGRNGLRIESGLGNKVDLSVINGNRESGILFYNGSNGEASLNKIEENGKNGIYFEESRNNTISNMQIDKSGEEGVLLNLGSFDNTFENVSTFGNGKDDLKLTSYGINGTKIIDSNFGAYTFLDSMISFKRKGVGEVVFLMPLEGSGKDLSNDIKISNNLVVLNSSQSGFMNKQAIITLENLPNGANRVIMKDGNACSGNECESLTSLDGSTVKFLVKGLGEYSVGTVAPPSAPMTSPVSQPDTNSGSSSGSGSSGSSSRSTSRSEISNLSFVGQTTVDTLEVKNSDPGKIELTSSSEVTNAKVTGEDIGQGYNPGMIAMIATLCALMGIAAVFWYKTMNGSFW